MKRIDSKLTCVIVLCAFTVLLLVPAAARAGSVIPIASVPKTVKPITRVPVPILLRLEDVSPWYALNANRLALLRQIAGYLGSQHVPFHVSMIPIYINPVSGEELGLWDTSNPRIQEFVETIRYMVQCGGIIGLHGCTHQMGTGITASSFEFSADPHQPEGTLKYMADRVNAALDLAAAAHIPITYWETPHYTASSEQYHYLENRFSILYEPGPQEYSVKEPYLVQSSNATIKSTCFIPTPLGMVEDADGFLSILHYAFHPRNHTLASLFFHPFRERLLCSDGSTLNLTDVSADYVESLVRTFRQQGFTFVRVTDIRRKLLRAGARPLS